MTRFKNAANCWIVLCALFIAFSMGLNSLWWLIWNMSPLIFAVGLLNSTQVSQNKRMVEFISAIVLLILISFSHLSMHFDIAGSATGSSTSALAYVTLPIAIMLVTVAVYLVLRLGLTIKHRLAQ